MAKISEQRIIFEDGMYPEHDVKNPNQRDANLRWFTGMWAAMNIGGHLVTDAGIYFKTDQGFRKRATH